MNKEIKKFGNMEIETLKLCYYIDKLNISKKVSFLKRLLNTLFITKMTEKVSDYIYCFQNWACM